MQTRFIVWASLGINHSLVVNRDLENKKTVGAPFFAKIVPERARRTVFDNPEFLSIVAAPAPVGAALSAREFGYSMKI